MPAPTTQASSLFRNQFQRCEPHALPFRIIFDEYLARRQPDLNNAINECLPNGGKTEIKRLEEQLAKSEQAYAALEEAKNKQQDFAEAEGECRNADLPLKQILHSLKGSALCLSGGGIRSASYCLGVLEGLARFSRQASRTGSRLLDDLDYLSTVSGGGYIGSWLMAWAERLSQAGQQHAFRVVVDALADNSQLPSGDPEPQPVRHLRSYTSFLAPELGLTLDTFTLVAIVLRNLFVTWLMLVPIFTAALALPLVSWSLVPWVARSNSACTASILAVAAAACFVVAAAVAAYCLPSHHGAIDVGVAAARTAPRVFVGLVALGSWLLTESWLIKEERNAYQYHFGREALEVLMLIALACFGALAFSFWRSYRNRLKASETEEKHSGGRFAAELLGVFFSTVSVSAVSVALLYLLGKCLLPKLALERGWCGDRIMLFLALPSVCCVLLVGSALLSGLLSDYEQEEDREWWGRAGGLILALVLVWVAVHATIFYARHWWTGAVGLLLGLLGSLVGLSPATTAGTRTIKLTQLSGIGKFLARHHLVLPSACGIALAFLFLGMSWAEQTLLNWHPLALTHRDLLSSLALLVVASLAALLLNWAINVNTFSLHGMYRMRLMRAFLGASNPRQRPNPFTNFDPEDSRREEQMLHQPGAPMHIINTTLNLVGAHKLAWQQRKAEPFSMSPLHCGSWRRAYASASIYGGDKGVSLATAMAISGAAFNPNMGYNSSPLVTLLMTVFNARLGWWLPNPASAEDIRGELTPDGRAFLGQNSPWLGLSPLLREAFGRTDDTYRWIELTDGGHFENLGLYEMVLRRCHLIIVVDASTDPECHFEDLGNALRKIEIDLGIPIRFAGALGMEKGAKPTNHYSAVATIDYGCVDASPDKRWTARPGKLVYIKPGLNGSEPPDVTAYAGSHPLFPHESTADQFFNETQFESYRHLGSYVVEQIAKLAYGTSASVGSMESFAVLAEASSGRSDGARPEKPGFK
jgi:hypothetical protein